VADKVPNLGQSSQTKPLKVATGPTVIDPSIKAPAGSVQTLGPTTVPPTTPTVNAPWMSEIDDYLSRAGWNKLGTSDRGLSLWQDPLGTSQSGKRTPTVRLPIQGGGEEQIYQCILPPVVWNYTSDEAMTVQRYREYYGQGLEQLIRVKERELTELKAKLKAKEIV
jgi:hypothetical protein